MSDDLLLRTHDRRSEFLDLLERFVAVESPTKDKAASDRMADALETTLRADGWTVARDPREAVGDVLAATLAGDGVDRGTLVLAHYDTVWPVGTLDAMPFRVDPATDRAYGPGSFDMKGGIVAVLLAARVLAEAARRPRGRITLLATSDEETGSEHSRARIEAEARGHDRVLVVEGSRDDGALKIGRKGTGGYRLAFHGVPAHAGNYPDDGASALVELAHAVLFVRSLDDREAGTTVHPTVARAGTVTNVITEDAWVDVDLRVLRAEEATRVDDALRAYLPRDPRVRVAVTGGLNRPPMEPTSANRALFDQAQGVLRGWGRDVEGAVVGGGSDGNFTSALGVPTLDGIGACGAGAHARDEHVRIADTLERAALLAALLAPA